MGLFDAVKTLVDMKKLGGLEDTIEAEIKKLEEEGKLPADLKSAYEAFQSSQDKKSDGESGNLESTVAPLENLATALKNNISLFPENVQKLIEKYGNVAGDLEGIAERFDKKN